MDASLRKPGEMADFLLLMETAIGQATLSRFAKIAVMSLGVMRARLLSDEPLRAYYLKVIATVTAQLKAEEIAA